MDVAVFYRYNLLFIFLNEKQTWNLNCARKELRMIWELIFWQQIAQETIETTVERVAK